MFDVAMQKFDPHKHYFTDPFPHIFIEKALTPLQVQEAKLNFRDRQVWRRWNNNQRIDYVFPSEDYTSLFNQLCDIFGISQWKQTQIYPTKRMLSKTADNYNPQVVSHNCISVYNSDIIESESDYNAKFPHRDREEKIFTGLIYLAEEDDVQCGNLHLYKASPSKAKHRNLNEIQLAKIVPYKTGNLIIMMNSNIAIHSVGERKPGPYDRIMLVTTFDTNNPQWMASITTV